MLTLLLVAAYLIGAIPFGYIIARAKGIDITKVGSGNIGATNVTRALGPRTGILVLLLDVFKGWIPAALAWRLLPASPHLQEMVFAVGVMAVVGHSLSPFLGFKGGKGIATTLGAILATSPIVALGALAIFILGMAVCRFVSLSSLIAAVSTVPFGFLVRDASTLIGAYFLLVVFLIYRHRANIERLRNGTEPKFTLKRQPLAPPGDGNPGPADASR